jgi:hypothetical protein
VFRWPARSGGESGPFRSHREGAQRVRHPRHRWVAVVQWSWIRMRSPRSFISWRISWCRRIRLRQRSSLVARLRFSPISASRVRRGVSNSIGSPPCPSTPHEVRSREGVTKTASRQRLKRFSRSCPARRGHCDDSAVHDGVSGHERRVVRGPRAAGRGGPVAGSGPGDVSRSAERKCPASPCIRHAQGLGPAEPSGASGLASHPVMSRSRELCS